MTHRSRQPIPPAWCEHFEMVSLIIVALAWCSMLVMLGIETGIYIREFRWYVRFGAAYVLVGDAVMLNLILSVTDFYTGSILYDDEKVIGIATNDMGIAKDGSRRDNFQCGVEFKGGKFYQVWEIDSSKHEPGHVLHTLGWPLDNKTYGGSFLYHMKDRQVSLGLVVALNYHNPFLNPYEEFQKLKHHPAIKPLLEGATVLQYGARTLNEGGLEISKTQSRILNGLCRKVVAAQATPSCRPFAWINCTQNKNVSQCIQLQIKVNLIGKKI
ncbi:hypothetical protein HYC85_019758 [Camellia sinensis]|uniref:Electron transfer flavoprotein-ubiquinone oxidoreductase n=1 Tax=Camellia sinensis TaxID=4442 RepID=A0A7J7GRJ1_CAMSI|nr:hypothetical protein HYC85_019758 [Camellia sinensis]